MQLVDLVLQGVKRFSQSQKIPFKPGFNLIFGQNESGKTVLFDCLIELMFPDRIVDLKKDWQTWKSTGPSRAGLTLQQAETFYRILKDFNQNAISLSRRAPGQEKFERLSGEPSEISAILSEELNLPAYQDYKTLFLESRFWLPSYAGIEKSQEAITPGPEIPPEPAPGPAVYNPAGMNYPGLSQPGFSGPGIPGIPDLPGFSAPGYMGMPGMPGMPGVPGLGMPGDLMGEDDGLSWEDKQKRLDELKAQLDQIKEAEETQFEIDGYNAKIFDIEKEKEKIKQYDQEIEGLNTELENYRFFRNLPENIDQRIAQYDSIETNRAKDIEAIDEKMVALDDELRYYLGQPKFYERGFFKIGAGLIGAGIFCLILRAVLKVEFFQYLGILMAPGVILAGIALWHFLTEESKRTDLKDHLKRLEDQKRNVVKEYQVRGAIVKRLLEQTRCDDTRELKEMLITFRELEDNKKELSRKKKELLIELDLDKLGREQEELRNKIPSLEEKLRGSGVAGMEKTEIGREIARLEGSLTRAKQLGLIRPPGQAARPGEAVPSITAAAVPDVGKTQMTAPARRGSLPFWEQILDSGGRLFGFGSKEMFEQILGRANLYLQTLSSKRYLEFRKDGDQILVKLAEMDHEQELSQLGKTAANLVYLSLKFALLEIAIQKYQLPILLDDPYLVLDESRFLTVAKTLKRLSGKTQVIIFSSQKIFAQEADQALSLS